MYLNVHLLAVWQLARDKNDFALAALRHAGGFHFRFQEGLRKAGHRMVAKGVGTDEKQQPRPRMRTGHHAGRLHQRAKKYEHSKTVLPPRAALTTTGESGFHRK